VVEKRIGDLFLAPLQPLGLSSSLDEDVYFPIKRRVGYRPIVGKKKKEREKKKRKEK
jgi:hypothetical protein